MFNQTTVLQTSTRMTTLNWASFPKIIDDIVDNIKFKNIQSGKLSRIVFEKYQDSTDFSY